MKSALATLVYNCICKDAWIILRDVIKYHYFEIKEDMPELLHCIVWQISQHAVFQIPETVKIAVENEVATGALNVSVGLYNPPLLIAIYHNNFHVAEYLLKMGAAVDVKDYNKNTALHIACEKGNTKVVELLLQYNAPINVKNNNGEYPHDVCHHYLPWKLVECLDLKKDSPVELISP